MGQGRHSQLYRFLKHRIAAMFTVLAALVCIMGYLYVTENRLDIQRNAMIDVMGRQRMLSQMMAKEATRVSLLYTTVNSPDRIEAPAVLLRKIAVAKSSIASARITFGDTLKRLQSGQFLYQGQTYRMDQSSVEAITPILANLEPEWQRFYEALRLIEQMDGVTPDTRNAMIVINSASDGLLRGTVEINSVLLKTLELNRNVGIRLFAGVFALIVVVVLAMLYDIYRHVMLPMDLFYQKISEVGISKHSLSLRHGSIDPVLGEMNSVLEGCRDIISLIENINQKSSFYDTLRFIYDAFRKYIPYSYIGIALFDPDHPTRLNASYGISDGTFEGLPGRLLGQYTELSETTLGAIMGSRKPRIINDLELYSEMRPPKKYTQIIMEEGIRSSITLPLRAQGRVLGFIFFSSRKKNEYSERHSAFLETIVNALTISFEKNIFADELLYSSVLALAKLAEAKDEDTGVHLDRIKAYTTLMTGLMKTEGIYADRLTEAYIKDVIRFSPMHDIGKVGIRDEVLLKPGRLTADEFEYIKTHATFGGSVLREAEKNILRTGKSMFEVGIEIAERHHEKWDGSGYPGGLAGESIPLSARIVAVVDVFDALTTRRPYKAPVSFDEAVEIIRQGAGAHFDPALTVCFLTHADAFREKLDLFSDQTPELYS